MVVGSSLSSLGIYYAISFWLVEFLLRNNLVSYGISLVCYLPFFSLLLLIFYLSLLVFVSLITMCLSVFLPGFILHGTPALLADYFLSYVQEVFRYYLFKCSLGSFLSFPPGTPVM